MMKTRHHAEKRIIWEVPMHRFRLYYSPAVLIASFAYLGSVAHAWTPPQNVTNLPSGQRAVFPDLTTDGNGDLHMVWLGGYDPTSNWYVWFQSYNGVSWTSPITLSTNGGSRPDLITDGSNTLHLCYEDDGEDNVWYRQRVGANWSSPTNLQTGGRSISPHIAATPDGTNILVAWHEDFQVGNEWDIFVNIYSNGSWSGVQNISTDGDLSSEPRVTVDQGGNFHVVWQSDGEVIYHRQRYTNGLWNSITRLDHTAERSISGDIATGPDGQVHVVFSEDNGSGGWEVWHRAFDGSTWSPLVNVSNHSGATDDVGAVITVDAYNRMHVVWHDFDNIFYSTKPVVGGAWSARQAIVSGQYSCTEADIATGINDTLHVTWQSRPAQSSNWNVYYSSQSNPPPGPRGTISGTITDEYGAGVSGAAITINSVTYGVSGAGGSYSVLIAPGTYSVTADKAYYAGQTIGGVSVVANQTTNVDFSIDAQEPAAVTAFTVTGGNQQNQLSWTNPPGNFTATVLAYSTDAPPATVNDGTLLENRPAAPGSNDSTTHTGLANGTTYYYSAFAYWIDASTHYAIAAHAEGTPAGPADYDRDGDVDAGDHGKFQICRSGDGISQDDPNCEDMKFDSDDDVDNDDFNAFMQCWSGPNIPANPHCAG
jgi:hypothetical protein